MNYQEPPKKITSMLFSDLKGYSRLPSDLLMERAIGILETEVNHLLRPGTHDYHNTWGDAYFISSSDPVALAEIALRMRDFVRNIDWIRQGFPENLAIRVALHIASVVVRLNSDNSIRDLVGDGVNASARIEPITKPNAVYCSAKFFSFLDTQTKIRGVNLGKKSLAKEFGEMELYQLRWEDEIPETPQRPSAPANPIPMPNIKRKFGDRQKSDFLYKSFADIKAYFTEALAQLEAANTGIESRLRSLNDTTFTCETYIDGKTKAQCKIWIDSHFGREQILFSEGRFDIEGSGAYNEAIRVEDDGTKMYLKSSFNNVSSYRGYDTSTNPSSPEQIAEYLWARLTRWLNAR